jgi:hypothetical protein
MSDQQLAQSLGSDPAIFDPKTFNSGSSGQGLMGDFGGALSNAAGVYTGIDRGGVSGYGKAAVSGAKLANSLGYGGSTTNAIAGAAPYLGAATGFYNAHKVFNDPHVTTKSGAMAGAAAGAALGPVGMIIGAAVGAIVGASNKQDPEEFTRQGYYDFINKNNVSGDTQSMVDPKQFYQSVAGEFRGKRSAYPPRSSGQYGRFDEDKFIMDMGNKINSAYDSGTIKKGDSAQTIVDKVVNPWFQKDFGGYDTSLPAEWIKDQKSMTLDLVSRYISGSNLDWGTLSGGAPNKDNPLTKYHGLLG